MKWENLTSLEFDDAIEKSKGLCILPIGCLEKHGSHIVTGCDGYIVQHIADLATEREAAVIFPTGFWLGEVAPNHSNDAELLKKKKMRGYISLKPQTIMNILEELCDEIHRNGFTKILIVNGHGGNNKMLASFVRSILYKKRNYSVCTTNVNTVGEAPVFYNKIISDPERFSYLTEEELATLKHYNDVGFGGSHADFRETAFCMAQSEDYVRPENFNLKEGESIHRVDYLEENFLNFGGAWAANYPNAFSASDPVGCTQNIGKAFCDIVADELAEKIRVYKNETETIKIASRVDG